MMLTFNHEPFIGEAIEGFLMQETDFSCELVIAEDCSTDKTREVIRKYWQQHPDRIRVLLNRTNIGARHSSVRAYQRCRGQYVTYLDGDDCWTSPDKLQRQADFLDAHPDHALCFHSVTMTWEDGSREPTVFRPRDIKDSYTLEDLLGYNFIGACSPMYRKGVFDAFPTWHFLMPVGDWSFHVLHAQHGRIGYIDEPMGMYRQHSGGVYSGSDMIARLRLAIEMLRRFRCSLGVSYRAAVDRSLYSHYDRLARQHCDEGNLAEARRCVLECFRQVGPGLHAPPLNVLKLLFLISSPRLHGWLRRVAIGADAQGGAQRSAIGSTRFE